MKKKITFFVLLIIALIFIVLGIINNDFLDIMGFGIFICLDCIGIS